MKPLQILVVDDEDGIRDVFRVVLEEDGHRVETCETGEEALERLRTAPFDLVFLDIKLPGISGIEVLQDIRRRGETPRVVMITGVLDDDLYDLSIYSNHAANGFITKPCSFQSIKDCVVKVMGDEQAFIRTPRDEFRYAATKVRAALERDGRSLAVAEFSEGLPLSARVIAAFGFGGVLHGSLGLHGAEALRHLMRDDPEFTEEGGLHSELTARLLAEVARRTFKCDWSVALTLSNGPLSGDSAPPEGTAYIAIAGPEGPTTVLRKRFTGEHDQVLQDACHAVMVHLHGALPGSATGRHRG